MPNYVQYFGSNIVEGVTESWVEAEMSWVEVDGAGWRWVHGLVIPKKEQLTPTFAKVKISLKNASFKLKWKIATLIMETEVQNKYLEKRKLKKELKQIRNILKRNLNLVILNAVFHQLSIALKSKFKAILNRHQKKLTNLRKQ